jgi:hypothetical protein
VNKIQKFLQTASSEMVPFFVKAGDKGMALLWCGVLSLILFLLFILTANVHTNLLEIEVNRALAQNGYGRSLGTAISPWRQDGTAMQLGSWWTMRGSGSLAVVFPVIRDGIYTPFLGIIATDGSIEFIPLSKNAEALYKRLPPGIIDVYSRRLHLAAEKVTKTRTEGMGK